MKSLPHLLLAQRRAVLLSRMVLSSTVALLLACGALFSAQAVQAESRAGSQTALRPGLIVQAVNEGDRVVLSGNTHPLATRAADRGPVSPSTPAERMLLLLRRSSQQELALRAAIESLHDSNSPNFHKWLTPAEFGAQWGAADSDIAAVTAWLQAHGFQVAGPTEGRTAIEFSGTVGQVQEAFHTSIHQYQVQGEMHHANASDPEIPAALAPVVAGISTLNDFHPKSTAIKGRRGIYNLTTHTARPELTDAGQDYDFLYVGPSDAATIYDTPNKAMNPAATGKTYDGTGATIGIIGDSNISIAQNANYRKIFGLAAKAPTVILAGSDPGENGAAVEAYLDTEVSNGIAPGAHVLFYTAGDTLVDYGLDLATLRAVNDNLADVISISFGECEGGLGTSGNQFYYSTWEQAAAQGISVTVSTGDSGSAGCDDPDSQQIAYDGLQINGLASTPFNVAVGGTDFAVLAGPDGSGSDFTKYVSEKNDPTTKRSATGFIPEVPWNDSNISFPPGSLADNTPNPAPYGNIAAGSGGKSNCAVGFVDNNGNLVCDSGYPKPSWQSAPGVAAETTRSIPDVSLFSSNGFYYAAWGICTDQDATNAGPVADCTPGSNGLPADEFYIYGVGGTSASAPAFAGILALVRQATGERQGQADYVLYNLARTAPTSFHDVLTGNNAVPCQKGTLNCLQNAQGLYIENGWNAYKGYDLATGLGSVDASALVANWTHDGLTSTSTKLTLTPTTIQHGEIVTADVTVTTAQGADPTGKVEILAQAHPPALPLDESIGAYSISGNGSTGPFGIRTLPGGSYNVVASYGGSTENTVSVSNPVAVTVTPETSSVAVSLSAYDPVTGGSVSTYGVPYGDPLGYLAEPYGNRSIIQGGVIEQDGYPTGTVSFSVGGQVIGSGVLGAEGYTLVNGKPLSPGKYTVTAQYGGDPSFDPSTGTAAFEVIKAPTSIKLAASATAYAGKPIVFTITMSTNSAEAAPTGVVELKYGPTVFASGELVGKAATDSTLASGTATISTANLPPGPFTAEAVYVGDVNYASSTSNSLALVGKPTFVLSNTTVTLPAEHSTAAAYITTKSEGGYQGTINYTCVLIAESKSTSAPAECGMYPATENLLVNGTVAPGMLVFGKGTKLPPGVTLGSNTPSLKLVLGAGGTVLACGLLFGIPARRRGWRAILSVLLLLAAFGGLSACVTPAKLITAGGYTFKVTGTDSKDATITSSATVKVNVL